MCIRDSIIVGLGLIFIGKRKNKAAYLLRIKKLCPSIGEGFPPPSLQESLIEALDATISGFLGPSLRFTLLAGLVLLVYHRDFFQSFLNQPHFLLL